MKIRVVLKKCILQLHFINRHFPLYIAAAACGHTLTAVVKHDNEPDAEKTPPLYSTFIQSRFGIQITYI